MIVVGLFLLILRPTGGVGELRLQIAMLLVLALVNFVLLARLLQGRPLVPLVAYAASALDLVAVTVLVLSQGGDSPTFVLYFPALVALSVAFEPIVMITRVPATLASWIAATATPASACRNQYRFTLFKSCLVVPARSGAVGAGAGQPFLVPVFLDPPACRWR